SYFLKKAAKLDKGSQTPGRGVAGSVSVAQLEEIAEQKMQDLNAVDVAGAVAMLRGSALSMGLQVTE
ncbi:MAG: 50S ribosomal protein L11, partial [Pseudomonadota bacterium]